MRRYRLFVNDIYERIKLFTCTFEIEVNGEIKQYTIEAPRLMLEQEFMSLIQGAANRNDPIKVKISRREPIYIELEDKWIDGDNSITFTNNAYNQTHKDETGEK